jgi:hypothetical protein
MRDEHNVDRAPFRDLTDPVHAGRQPWYRQPASSSSNVPSRWIASKVARRGTMNASPSAWSSVWNASVAPFASYAARMASISCAAAAPGASDRASSSAPADRSRPIVTWSSTALMLAPISSSMDRRSTVTMLTTASAAASIVGTRRPASRPPGERTAHQSTPRYRMRSPTLENRSRLKTITRAERFVPETQAGNTHIKRYNRIPRLVQRKRRETQ